MGAVTGMLGLGGGAAGSGFAAPSMANITNPVTQQQIGTSYSDTQNSMKSQQDLLGALQAQNGLQNQSNVYNQLQGVVAGTGPNPAQAMLNNATGANVANQAALMAGQRGAGANVGLMARQAAQQGANTQQQSVGQGAQMQAQQSLGALGQAGAMAGTQAANQIGQTNANTAAQQAEQQALLNAQAAYNNAQVGGQSSVNSGNAALAGEAMKGQQGLIGGLMGGLSGGLGSMKAEGGMVGYADGGSAFSSSGPQSKFGQFLKGAADQINENQQSQSNPTTPEGELKKGANALGNTIGQGIGSLFSSSSAPVDSSNTYGGHGAMTAMASGGKVPAMVSPGEVYLKPEQVKDVAQDGKNIVKAERIPGQPKYPGNDYRNDVVPKNLDEGGVVIPNKILQSKDPVNESAKFVRDILAKRRG